MDLPGIGYNTGRRKRVLANVLVAVVGLWVHSHVQACPGAGPISVLVPYAAGGSVDATTRLVAKALAHKLARSVLVVNVPGASGLIAVRQLLGMPRDGCTMLSGTVNTVVLLPLQNSSARFTTNDLIPVARTGSAGLVLVASNASGLHDVAGLRAAARSSHALRAGHPGVDSLQALSLRTMELKLQTKFVQVPYSGAGNMLNDLIAGHIDVAVLAQPAALPLIRQGRVRQLSYEVAIGAGVRLPSWSGWFAPRGAASADFARLQQALQSVLKDPKVVQGLADMGVETGESPHHAFVDEIASSVTTLTHLLALTTLDDRDADEHAR